MNSQSHKNKKALWRLVAGLLILLASLLLIVGHYYPFEPLRLAKQEHTNDAIHIKKHQQAIKKYETIIFGRLHAGHEKTGLNKQIDACEKIHYHHAQLGKIFAQHNRIDEALNHYRKAASYAKDPIQNNYNPLKNKKDLRSYYASIFTLCHQQHNYHQALTYLFSQLSFCEQLHQKPNFWQSKFPFSLFIKASTANPILADVCKYIAHCFFAQTHYQNAKMYYQKAYETYRPDNKQHTADYHAHIAHCFKEMSSTTQAIKAYTKAIQTYESINAYNDQLAHCYHQRAQCYEQQDATQQAIQDYKKSAHNYSKKNSVQKARCYLIIGNDSPLDESIYWYKKSLKTAPTSAHELRATSYHNLIVGYQQLGDWGKAIQSAHKAKAELSEYPEAHQYLEEIDQILTDTMQQLPQNCPWQQEQVF